MVWRVSVSTRDRFVLDQQVATSDVIVITGCATTVNV